MAPTTTRRAPGARTTTAATTGSSALAPAIATVGLTKRYGEKVVLDGVDLHVDDASVYALLGPNGAGKTTMVHLLSTLIRPDGGTARVAGHDVATDADGVRATIGLTGQFSSIDKLLTGAENLRLMADLLHLGRAEGRRRVGELLERFDLVEAADTSSATYSGGMLRRLDLAMTLMGEPRIIFLDEPTTGLDPRSRRTMWTTIRDLVAAGTTIFLTTQYLEEADDLAHRIGVLDGGRLVAEGTPAELKQRVPGGFVLLRFAENAPFTAAAAELAGSMADAEALTLQVPSDGGVRSLRRLLDRLAAASVDLDADVAELSVHTPDLDDVFFALTGQPATS